MIEGPQAYEQPDGKVLKLYRLSQTTIWEAGSGEIELTFAIYENTSALDKQIAVFRRALWNYLGLATVLLLLLQTLVLRWSLLPLRQLEKELKQVRARVERNSVVRPTISCDLDLIADRSMPSSKARRSGLFLSKLKYLVHFVLTRQCD